MLKISKLEMGAKRLSALTKISETQALFDFTHLNSLPKLAAIELFPPLDDFFSNGVRVARGTLPTSITQV